MFEVGDKVVYPQHGAGVVVGRETKTVLGEARDYLTIRIIASEMTLMVPADATDAAGLSRGSASNAATAALRWPLVISATAASIGSGIALRRAQRRRIGRRRVVVAVASPLRRRQQPVGVGPLPQPEPPLGIARLFAPALPCQQPEIAQPGERIDDGAAAAAGLARDRVERRVEPAGPVVQEVEQQHVERRRARCGR